MKHYVYILTCKDGTYYTGYTKNVRKRINQHNGVGYWPGGRYTITRRPVFLSHLERFLVRKDAVSREKEIKDMNHDEKTSLIESTTKEQILNAI